MKAEDNAVTRKNSTGKDVISLPEVRVQEKRLPLQNHPGAASVVTEEQIETYRPLSTEDVLRTVPGLHIADEDGRGLRPNIGIRGLDPTRSSHTLITADGIPIQPAVYGEPDAYYNVPVDDVQRIEVIKGGASVLYGPNTVGGVVNYVLRRPPPEQEIRLKETIREGALFSTTASYGNTFDHVGVLGQYNKTIGETLRQNTRTNVDDATLHAVFPSGSDGETSIRLNAFKEDTQTPGGLSAAQFRADPRQSQRSFDFFEGRRLGVDLSHTRPITDDVSFEGRAYANTFERNWFVANAPDSAATSNTQFLRDFVVAGVEPRLMWDGTTVGMRLHYEQLDDVLRRGPSPRARTGTTTQEADLSTVALAGYALKDFAVTDGLTITPGIRFEHIEETRKIVQGGRAAGRSSSLSVNEIVGGIGALQKVSESVSLFANYSRSFKPPTFSQAVDPTTGTTNDLAAESSNNYELGLRGYLTRWLSAEVTGFWIDYKDQVISEAGRLRNAGDTRHRGIETALSLGPWSGFDFAVGATLLETEFQAGANRGNELPMAPNVTAFWKASYREPTNFGSVGGQIDGYFVDEQFTDAANTIPESANGNTGRLAAYDVWNLRFDAKAQAWTLFAGVNNLFDEAYRVRRQAFFNGIFPGQPRTFYVGASLKF